MKKLWQHEETGRMVWHENPGEGWFVTGLLSCPQMETERDLDDLAKGNPLAQRQLKALRDEIRLLTHKCITCGVAASHPDAGLAHRGAYASVWDSSQAQAVRELRADRDRLKKGTADNDLT